MSTTLTRFRKFTAAGSSLDWSAITLKPAEMAAAGLLVLAIAALAGFYLFFVSSEQSRLEKLHTDFARNREEIERLRKEAKTPDTSGQTVAAALKSADDFQAMLKPVSEGRRDIIEEVNQLAGDSGVSITDAVQFTAIRESEDLTKPARQAGEVKSAFPGLAVQLAVDGQYENLREFISKLERSKNFLVMNQIQLEGIEELQRGQRGAKATGKIEKISLRLNLDTYFRRES